MRHNKIVSTSLMALFILVLIPYRASAQNSAGNAAHTPATAAPPGSSAIPDGTIITMQNWRQYTQFMPVGMEAFFGGSYFWKMPSDVQMVVGPTVVNPLPKNYIAATEKYSGQTRIVDLGGGALNLEGYQGGEPFPDPSDPHKGWKILANLWYRYVPNLTVDTAGSGCLVDSGGSVSCEKAEIVHRQLGYNTDPGVPSDIPGAEGKFYAQWLMVLEPEQKRYTASLVISYKDLTRSEDQYAFIPALRRAQPVSTLARCSPSQGTDSTQEDYREGFDSNITQLQVQYLGEKKILAMFQDKTPSAFPDDFDMPLGWPKPSWGKWQVRDVYVISVSKIPSQAQSYCYGKRVMYIDKTSYAPLWEELYDKQMRPWRFVGLFLHPLNVPGIGPVDSSGSIVYAFWDVQNNHSTFFTDPLGGSPYYVNEQAPKDYFDVSRYTTPSGLNLIMR